MKKKARAAAGRGARKAKKTAKPAAKARARKAAKPVANARVDLTVTDRGRPRSDLARLRRVVRAALRVGQRPSMPVSLLLTDDAEISALHAQFLGDPTPTDVISFELDGAAELVVSVETAKRCAKERGHKVADEVALYVTHGTLHVCGFDDIRKQDRARMRQAEREALSSIGIDIDDVDA
jgi:probable rRNA maturation factor